MKADEENVKDVLRKQKNQVGTLGLGRAIREDEEYRDEEYVQDCMCSVFLRLCCHLGE